MNSTVNRRVAHTTDIDEARRSMSTLFGATMGLTADPPKGFQFDMAATADTGLDAAAMRFSGSCRSGTDSFPDIVIAHAVQGRHRWRMGNETGPGTVPFIVPPDRELRVEFSELRIRTLRLETDLVRKVARTMSGRDPGPLRMEGLNAASSHHRLVAETLRFIESTLIADAELADAPLARAGIVHQATVSILTAYPLTDIDASDSDNAPRAVRRAVAYMEEHAHEPITMADVAEAAGFSTRALQSAFRRRFDVTPSQYLRLLRLRAAHDELRDSYGPRTSVREVARRWGFVHAGRFAHLYTVQYGERPSDTLRR
jgi:AraC-like DNA-binding protein